MELEQREKIQTDALLARIGHASVGGSIGRGLEIAQRKIRQSAHALCANTHRRLGHSGTWRKCREAECREARVTQWEANSR